MCIFLVFVCVCVFPCTCDCQCAYACAYEVISVCALAMLVGVRRYMRVRLLVGSWLFI